jgi:hypothetical protein
MRFVEWYVIYQAKPMTAAYGMIVPLLAQLCPRITMEPWVQFLVQDHETYCVIGSSSSQS